MLTREEAQQYYPNCVEAVLLHEHYPWSFVAQSSIINPRNAVEAILRTMKELIDNGMGGNRSYTTGIPLHVTYQQCQHPEFLKYVTAKLGGM